MRRALASLSLITLLAACAGPNAPETQGVCFRTQAGADGKPRFSELAHGVGNLETCAVLLEALHLKGGADVEGAYQGYFVFVDGRAITSGRHEGGLHYPIFQPPQRVDVDRDLRGMMAQNGGQMPAAAQISLERH